jgi:tRNA pseudouridine55 synthase
VLVVDKPAGPTSHDVVDRARRALGVRRVGHTGTLDPFATGVLPLCVGKATRLARFLSEGEKRYDATVRLGFATTTDDLTGQPLGPPSTLRPEREAIVRVCASLVGPLRQLPPAYSAKRVEGRRLYELARKGVAVDREAVSVVVHALQVTEVRGEEVDLVVRCSPGTYVRALARDLGEALGTGGHLATLRRTWSSGFGLEGAVTWDGLTPEAAALLRPLGTLLPELPAVVVGGEGEDAVRHGRSVVRAMVRSGFPDDPPLRVRVIGEGGDLLALAVPHGFGASSSGLRMEPSLHPDVVLVG